ncbi:penicillin-binding protein 2 [Cellulomonas sp. APG4]|uniref:peptidoglycan D,D-transpeptidase FtsI family protein n=1 Tax=Cellulomonas sp. APG4 TaxID=1538656 RepID=UPI00192A5A9C|nr:penicillin-binding protein 2 [Cellulomonas sp. APG4]
MSDTASSRAGVRRASDSPQRRPAAGATAAGPGARAAGTRVGRGGVPDRPGATTAPRGVVPRQRTRAGLGPARPGPPRPEGPASPRVPPPQRRQAIVLVAVLALLAVLAGRLVQVQVVDGPSLAARAFEKRLETVTIPAERGDIVDADGVVLATSVERWNIYVDQVQLAEAQLPAARVSEAAEVLSGLLGVPAAELGARLVGGDEPRRFVYLAKGVVPGVRDEVLAQRIPGVAGERTSDRVYPAGATGGNVLGFVGAEGFGQAGLELVHDELLAGEAGSETFERGAKGQRIPAGEHEADPAVPGHDLVLTLDRDLQYMVQSALDAQVRATGAQWGVVEVRDVRTGEVLALADSDAVDPNEPGATEPGLRNSRAVQVVYEPGSTAKVISMAAVLEQGLATPTSQYVVPDRYEVANGQVFKDSQDHPDQHLTLAGILAQSSNTGTVMVGQELPRQVRHDYLRKFGFGSSTGIGLPGESAGLLRDAEDWDGRSEYAVLFGQAVGSTTLQNTGVFATIANGGVSVPPTLVKGTRGPDGTMHPTEPAETEQVISPDVADTLVRMLEGAVAEGTGGNAAVPGYRVAGKTGTAQAFEPGGGIKIVASFIGIAPADDPRLVVNVALYDPKTSEYGGVVAAPVFSEVMGHSLQHLGIPPSGVPADLFPTEVG